MHSTRVFPEEFVRMCSKETCSSYFQKSFEKFPMWSTGLAI